MKWENVDLYKNSIIVLVYKKHHFSTNIKSIIVLIHYDNIPLLQNT